MRTIAQAARKLAVKQQQVRYKEQPKPKKKLKVVEPKRRQSRQVLALPEIPFPVFVMSVTVITAGIIINVAQQAIISQQSYMIESVKKEIQVAQQAQDNLYAHKAILQSPQRIESVAVEKLSMVKAPKVSYLRILDDGSRGISSTGNTSPSMSASGDKHYVSGKSITKGRVEASYGGRLGYHALAR
ncbi:MAG: hypothetical protein COW32_03310 [Candidatus Aquicultor secundus]|uniref:Cell division protein FtsL n=1 Tax=Candidatus Aquicultor secundus TaxID=1973895 RepID=A0A2M7TC81_9ACTN|nr:hypothetical protein [Candidatus Aquicultor secundus]NCO66798.1 hypothetical protein [Solirubrobacter sp.]OIO85525.1 MAG: hypothetical protein AUK32_07115 [Candidatus Aquicultor secundus]PIU26126.1 MAG: hypothetical protein COT10_10275 [Candidatus Aquicultor secundus]PIW22671.1 MAG: hypothetical protein COW32_03310 [Candidatus Aquicultor secundus]PIX52943.1 MAG: hypothetical protein COZ51_01480 [Candidatus Aquicultor secundus]